MMRELAISRRMALHGGPHYLNDWLVENMDRSDFPAIYRHEDDRCGGCVGKEYGACMVSGVKIASARDAAVYPHGLNARRF